MLRVAPNAFGNALGNSIVGTLKPKPTGTLRMPSEKPAFNLGSDNQFDLSSESPQSGIFSDAEKQYNTELRVQSRDINGAISDVNQTLNRLDAQDLTRATYGVPSGVGSGAPEGAEIVRYGKNGTVFRTQDGQEITSPYGSGATSGSSTSASIADYPLSDLAYVPGPFPVSRFNLGAASFFVNSGLNTINSGANVILNGLGAAGQVIDPGALISIEAGMGPLGELAAGATGLVVAGSDLIRASTAASLSTLRLSGSPAAQAGFFSFGKTASVPFASNPTALGATSEAQIFDHLWDQAMAADFSTPANKAAFYTGYPTNYSRATIWTGANDGFVIDTTNGGQWLTAQTYGPQAQLSRGQVDLLWETASARYASGASGDVHVFNSGVAYDPNKVLNRIELPILQSNQNVNIIWH